MPTHLEDRTYYGPAGQFTASLFLEPGALAPIYVLELTDPTGTIVQRTHLDTMVAYNLKVQHGIDPKEELFSVAAGYVRDVQKDAAFQAWLRSLGV